MPPLPENYGLFRIVQIRKRQHCKCPTHQRPLFEVLRWVGYDNAEPENREIYGKVVEEHPTVVAETLTYEEAVRFLQEIGVEIYQDTVESGRRFRR